MVSAWLATKSVLLACAIIWMIGLVVFMCPALPGPVLYLVSGIVITSAAMNDNKPAEERLNFGTSLGIASLVSIVLKLSACWVQQVILGAPLGRRLWGQKLIGVDR